ncbi:MAG: hypothetical protein IJO55_11910 [Lachnospiraceae bacterium]|nr:hypothetical protein [Lachnospiraceae bacterium]
MKTGKKIAVLLAVFVAALTVYFMWPAEQNDENGGSVTYKAMKAASLPVIYPVMQERIMAPLFGHREEKAVTAVRDSLLLLPEDRKLQVQIDEAEDIVSLSYEIRSLDMENLVERTELSDWKRGDSELEVILPIQNLIAEDEEYQLGICAELKDGSAVWYYARVLQSDMTHAIEMLALAEEYSQKTFGYESAQDLTVYMETSPTADNSSFGVVTLKNSFTQMTWGTLGVVRLTEPRITLKELNGDVANVQLEYEVSGTEEGKESEIYRVVENFTMKWATQRIYMMDYERRMNEMFTGRRELFTGKRITLGISDGEDSYAVKSADDRYVAFVNNRELWSYDTKGIEAVRVFAFGGADAKSLQDLRVNEDRHGVEVLQVSENGDIDFLVYGYMNRGSREGSTGISYYQYAAEAGILEEKFFIPAESPYEELKADLERLAHKGENEIFYLYMNHAVYGIDLTSKEYVVIASGLQEGCFAVSADQSRLAWQENVGEYDSHMLHVLDLNTGRKNQIGKGELQAYRILGFVGNDLVYGTGDSEDYITSNGRTMGLYMNALEITDAEMNSAMHYEKPGYYIRDVVVEESRIHIARVREKHNGFFEEVSEDTLVCNVETLPSRTDDIGWYADQNKGRVYFVQLPDSIPTGKRVEISSPKKIATDNQNVISLETIENKETISFYAYGRGRFLGSYEHFSDAVQAAYDCMGIVSVGQYEPIWIRANRPGAYFIRDVQTGVTELERNLDRFTGSSVRADEVLLLEATGTPLNQILYFVSENIPVLVNIGEGRYQYLTGYDQGHVRVFNPFTGQTETIAFEDAEERFESLGNDFICCISEN